MISLIKRLFGKGERTDSTGLSPENQFVVRVDNDAVVNTRPDGIVEKVRLSELKAVVIETNDSGPWGADVWWILVGNEKEGCVFPGGASGENEILEALQRLPGFDNEMFMQAMGSTSNRRFLCWKAAS